MASGWWKSTFANLALGSPVDFEVITPPSAPRGYPKLASIATGAGLFLGGNPCINIGDVVYYASDDYTQNTDRPPVYRWDGRLSTLVTEAPYITGTTPAKAILSLCSDDAGTSIYYSTWDSGTTSSDFTGRVFKFEIATGLTTTLDSTTFVSGKLPYGLVWFNDAVYVGVTKQNPSTTTEVFKLSVGTALNGGPTPTPVLTGTSYTYKILGINTVDGTGAGMARSAATSAVINRATLNATDRNELSWNNVGAASYKVERVGTGNIILTTTTSATDTGQATIGGAGSGGEPLTITPTVTNYPITATCTYRIGAVVNV